MRIVTTTRLIKRKVGLLTVSGDNDVILTVIQFDTDSTLTTPDYVKPPKDQLF